MWPCAGRTSLFADEFRNRASEIEFQAELIEPGLISRPRNLPASRQIYRATGR